VNEKELLRHFRNIEACIKSAEANEERTEAWESLLQISEHYGVYELIAADDAMKKVPLQLQKHFSATWGTGLGNRQGEFQGLTCTTCHHWRPSHAKDCPVYELEVLLREGAG
jgi:hypothetical protein